jgi:hypothetical protein
VAKNPWSTRGRSRDAFSPVLVALLLGIAVSGFFFVRMRSAESRLEQSRIWTRSVLDSLARSVETPPPPIGPEGRDSVYWQWVSLGARMDARRFQNQLREAHQRRGNLLDAGELASLREAGLTDPARQLRDSLLTRADLIPFKPALGGRQRFVTDEIVLLHRPYVFAYAEDGHRGGYLLLGYDVLPDHIRWRRIWWAELD